MGATKKRKKISAKEKFERRLKQYEQYWDEQERHYVSSMNEMQTCLMNENLEKVGLKKRLHEAKMRLDAIMGKSAPPRGCAECVQAVPWGVDGKIMCVPQRRLRGVNFHCKAFRQVTKDELEERDEAEVYTTTVEAS